MSLAFCFPLYPHLNLVWNSGKSYLHNYHLLFSFFKHNFYQLFHSPGCFTVPDGQLLILAIRDNGVRLYLPNLNKLLFKDARG